MRRMIPFNTSLRLCCSRVAMTQPSSAFIERVFTQLTFIRRTTGETSSRDTLELRAFVRCNNGLIDELEY